MEETPQRVLVVTPHPDDAEVWCGGTVARWIKEGAEVNYVLCTDGGKGTDIPGITSKELSATREQEQREAAQVLGVKHVEMLHIPDDYANTLPYVAAAHLRHSLPRAGLLKSRSRPGPALSYAPSSGRARKDRDPRPGRCDSGQRRHCLLWRPSGVSSRR